MPRTRVYENNAEKQRAYRRRKKSKKLTVHYQSLTDVRATPQHLFNELDQEFCFQLDVCALPDNAKCDRYFTPEIDGLRQEWEGPYFMNPPYGRVHRHMAQESLGERSKRRYGGLCAAGPH